jgi:hypothetical protein
MMGYMNPAHGRHMTGKISQGQADYTDWAEGADMCEDCANFRPPVSCSKVAGAISRKGCCELFERAM